MESQGFKATLERFKQINLGKINMLVDFQRSMCKNKVASKPQNSLIAHSTTYLFVCSHVIFMWVYVSRRRMCVRLPTIAVTDYGHPMKA